MQPELEDLFATIRKITRPRSEWGGGEYLYEQELIAPRRLVEDELAFAVIPISGEPPFEVSLYPLDDEWECECDNPSDCCEHVVAVMMAWQAADGDRELLPGEGELMARHPIRAPEPEPEPEPEPKKKPKKRAPRAASTSSAARTRRRAAPVVHVPVPRPKPPRRLPGPVGYRLTPSDHGLAVRRVVVFDDTELPLERRLTGDDGDERPPVATTPEDLIVQDALADAFLEGVFASEHLAAVVDALRACPDVTLDGEPVVLSDEPARMVAVVEDVDEDRFRLSAEREPTLDAEYANGLGRLGQTLRPLEEPTELSVHAVHQLGKGQVFDETDLWRLVVEILPDLDGKIPIVVRSERLPKPVLSDARAVVYARREGDSLHVEGMVVYGDPVLAKIVRNRLILVSAEYIPIREVDEELPLANDLRRDLGLVPSRPREYKGAEAVRFAQRLDDWEDGDVIGDGWESFLED